MNNKKDMEAFGKEVFDSLTSRIIMDGGVEDENTEGFMEIAQRHGLARLEGYDPKKHESFHGLERGDLMWVWD